MQAIDFKMNGLNSSDISRCPSLKRSHIQTRLPDHFK